MKTNPKRSESPTEESTQVSRDLSSQTPDEEVQPPNLVESFPAGLSDQDFFMWNLNRRKNLSREIALCHRMDQVLQKLGRPPMILPVFKHEVEFKSFLEDYALRDDPHRDLLIGDNAAMVDLEDSLSLAWQFQIYDWVQKERLSQSATVKDVVRVAFEEDLLSLQGYKKAIEKGWLPESGCEAATEEQSGHLPEGMKLREEEVKDSSQLYRKDTWDWVGLPERLRKLAQALSGKGLVKACDIKNELGEDASQITDDYENHRVWGRWVSTWIDKPDRSFYRLKRPFE